MQALRLVMLLVAVAVVYLLFLRSQPAAVAPSDQASLTAPLISPNALPPTNRARPSPTARSQYGRDMEQARAAAKLMQQQHAEADEQ